MFSIKNFETITASIINNIIAMSDELTDFNVGSNIRTLVEANAREMDQLYQSLLKGLYEAIPVSLYKAFDFQKLSAGYASGYVKFTRASGSTGEVVVPAETTVESPEDGLTYSVVAETTMAAEYDHVDVYVQATGTGTSYNVAADSITELTTPITGIDTINNDAAFTNGTDDETEIERKLRFQLWLSTIPRAIETAVEYGATTAKLTDDNGLTLEGVISAWVHEPLVDETPAGTAGEIDIYIWNGSDGASAELIAECKKIIDGYVDDSGTRIPGWKAAGVVSNVYAVTPYPVDITMVVYTYADADFDSIETDIKTAISTYIAGLDIADTLVRAELIDAAMSISGVYDVTVTTPAANVTLTSPAWHYIVTEGDVTISQSIVS
jgi:uncharacterized phage protein gp47/JayE